MRVGRSRARVAVAHVLLACAACADELPPVVWEGEHVRFRTDEDPSVICEGTLPHLDAVTGHLDKQFGQADARIDYVWAPEDVDAYCPPDTGGCNFAVDTVAAVDVVSRHEIVHAIRHGNRMYHPLEEGLAQAFGDDWQSGVYLASTAHLWSSLEEHEYPNWLSWPDYELVGNFVSFLRVHPDLGGLDSIRDHGSNSDSRGTAVI